MASEGKIGPQNGFHSTIVPILHHAANACVIALSIPRSISRVSGRVAWSARSTWMLWSAISNIDLQLAKRDRIQLLLNPANRVKALKALDEKLFEIRWGGAPNSNRGINTTQFTSIHECVQMWQLRERVNRQALMRCRMDRNFDKTAEIYFHRRLHEQYSKRAILAKAALTGATFGIIPHVLAWGRSSTLVEVESTISELLFGNTPLTNDADVVTSYSKTSPSTVLSVLTGLEMIAWYKKVLFYNDLKRSPGLKEGKLSQGECLAVEVEKVELGEDDVNVLMILDRKGKAPLLRSFFQ
eukprot:jgi/Bigna1/81020/fgenesh1_pg.76_\